MGPRIWKVKYVLIFAFVAVLIPAIVVGFQYIRDLRSNANIGLNPKNVTILNPSSNSFDIAWATDVQSVGKVMFGTSQSNMTSEATDIRGIAFRGYSHFVTVKNLDPDTTYFYKIVSDTTETSVQESFKTLGVISTDPINVFGTTSNDNADKILIGTLIEKGTANKVKATKLGSVINSNGSWTIDAGNFRTDTGSNISSFNNYLLQLEIVNKDGAAVSRKVTEKIASSEAFELASGSLDNPIEIASQFTDATGRVTDTPTPNPTTLPTTEPTAEPTNTPTPTNDPNEITVTYAKIVNVLDGTFAIVWETNVPTNSYLKYTINGSNSTNAFDKRSNEKVARSLRTHFVEITDTTNPAGTDYEVTLINNEIEWSEKITFEKVNISEVPSIDSVNAKFNLEGNYLDQVVIAEILDKSTKIALTPSAAGTGVFDLSALRNISDPSDAYTVSSSDTLTFTILGGELKDETTLNQMTVSTLRNASPLSVETTPDDLNPFEIIYINIKDGEVITDQKPKFSGEGLSPNSNLTIEIKKNE